jgi:hypothetical protein
VALCDPLAGRNAAAVAATNHAAAIDIMLPPCFELGLSPSAPISFKPGERARRQDDPGTPFGGHPCRDQSDAAGCAGDHEDLIFEGL